jgi:hypothetical protein
MGSELDRGRAAEYTPFGYLKLGNPQEVIKFD